MCNEYMYWDYEYRMNSSEINSSHFLILVHCLTLPIQLDQCMAFTRLWKQSTVSREMVSHEALESIKLQATSLKRKHDSLIDSAIWLR